MTKPWSATNFARQVIDYYHAFGRKHLPWQNTQDPYRIWLSEIMLQQTQVTTVIPYFERFVESFPTVLDLAHATDDQVMQHWSGLGYYSRARNLHKAAKIIETEFGGDFPQDPEVIETLPGIGRSTAGAIASFAFDQPTAILDGNVKRVLARCYAIEGWPGNGKVLKALWERAEANTPTQETAAYNQAMMDLGAVVCTRTKPNCPDCPLSKHCLAYHNNSIEQYPGKKPKKARPSKAVYWLISINETSDQTQVLLHKRPPSGIWGGLWALPEVEQQDISPDKISQLDPFVHKFSHYDLQVQPLLLSSKADKALVEKKSHPSIMEPAQADWFSQNQLSEIGLPTPVSKLLSKLLGDS
ncbi:A/G-specific adenine glycosylase [Kangiella koreensis]|uniref:Adenine DNA glycosylase n=1 Tax=Kangiella koreensis (strain DSM 16069 / JCM 12317 / KCTC 12182 / SW-125) TaxID=523791 RepID=C7R6W3_KANKD|nr:A/G-specific adenine glycosylase [Kangiella koreensis]ACV25629.1 A/G-specific adenine glycosylase [Kangiella koreensis DSM 16069]